MKNIAMIKIGTPITFWLDSEHNTKKTEVILSRERYTEDSGKKVNLYTTANHMVHEAQLVNEY
jgi:hypothetical protein